ncbi:YTH-domain-containing protein [Venturia nashicola]|uniref:YTH-domain-containing protein n=1 Tax=Venturia nashicola TaxID=86259 RepID=A0A4Z1P1F9_9PEZI|nr:YTH-domain-containing protein [Venturia nashicola]TLD21717.1 YTH-domain-containing protein [Venturia nashicola]
MDWQQPTQANNAPAYPCFAYCNQQDSNQPNYNYEEDSEAWDDDETEGYQNQNAYYYNEHQNVDTTASMGGYGGVDRTDAFKIEPNTGFVPPSIALANLETDIQNKAAILKAKILEKRASSSRGANKPEKEEIASAIERPTVDRPESDTAIDMLVKEARAAAEEKAKQNGSPYNEPAAEAGTGESAAQRVSPVDSTPTLSPTDTVQNPSKARKGGQKSSKQAKHAARAELRAQHQESAHKMSKARAELLAKHTADQNVAQPPSDMGHKINAPRPKETSTETIDTERQPVKSVSAAESKLPATLPPRSEALLATSTLQQEPSTALVPVVNISPQVAAEDGHDTVASYSRHFDDLDEWLEFTGYHDKGNREQTLSLHRRRVQLEREMAEIDRELEQTVAFRARSARPTFRRPSPTVSSMPPPSAPAVGIYTVGANTRAGEKRARSPELDTQHADKHQGTDLASNVTKPSSSDKIGTSSNALEIPSGPRRKDSSPGLNIRGAKKNSLIHKFGQGTNSTRTRSFSPTARRVFTAHDRPDDHTLRGPYAMREPSPKRPNVAAYGSRSPGPPAWSAHGESHRIGGIDQSTSYRGRQFSGSRGGSVSRGRSEHNANDSSLGLGLRRGGCRYFMIKSWNHENVQAALQEGTWATQVQNEELFAEAFRNSRHVIFFFSVNNSKAFQGYVSACVSIRLIASFALNFALTIAKARMESVPGVAPQPSWVQNLHWPSSPPFYIRWITTAETRFSHVGHLKNSLNEGHAVLVGRDGQEIEEGCGAALCEAIDEESKWNSGGGESLSRRLVTDGLLRSGQL